MGVLYSRHIIFIVLLSLLLIIIYLFICNNHSSSIDYDQQLHDNSVRLFQEGNTAKYLSYQPPGNGWNNQRIVIEMAMIMAKLLNRTLIVHPLSSHSVSERMKQSADNHFGYLAYNKMSPTSLLPLSTVMNLQVLSRLVPVIEVNTTHKQFLQKYSSMSWNSICHSMGYGYWVDQRPRNEIDKMYLSKQVFTLSDNWKDKCSEENKELQLNHNQPIIRYTSDLLNDSSDVIYFKEGCLFGIQIRFLHLPDARQAQEWIVEHFKYHNHMYNLVNAVVQTLGKYNAVHIRRIKHISRQLAPGYWIVEMLNKEFTKDVPIYISTDEKHLKWFDPFIEAGFKIYFASNFTEHFNLTSIPRKLKNDVLGIYEQLVCVKAHLFVPSPHSTFSNYILRQRGETMSKDGLLYENVIHTSWVGHNI